MCARPAQFGPNETKETSDRTLLEILIDRLANAIGINTIAITSVSGVLDMQDGGFPKDAIAIF